MAINKEVDNLGLTEEENLQIDALSLGASRQEVASISRQNIETVPEYIPSYYSIEEEYSTQESLYTPKQPSLPKKRAADMAMSASLADKDEGEVTTKYKGMYDQLREDGSSSIYDRIKQSVKEKELNELEEDIFSVARNGDVNTAQTLLEAADGIVNERASMRRAGLESATEDYIERSPGDIRTIEHARQFINSLGNNVTSDGRSIIEILDEQIDAEIRSEIESSAGVSLDYFVSLFTGEQLLGLANVGKDIFGERYNFLGGSLMRDLAQKYRSLPNDEKEAFGQKVVDSIAKHSGVSVTGDDAQIKNDLIKVFALETFREFAKTPGGDIPFDRWMANIFGTVEAAGLVPVAGLGRLLSRLNNIKKSPSAVGKNNPARNSVQDANPELDAVLSAEGIRKQETAEEIGTSQTQELERAYFSNKIDEDTYLQGAPNSVVEKIQGFNTISDEVKQFSDNTYLFHDKEYVQKQERLMNVFSDEKTIGKVKPSFSRMERDPNGNNIIVDAIYGNELDTPLTLGKAIHLSLNLRKLAKEEGIPLNEGAIKIVKKNEDLGVYETYSRKTHTNDGQFFVTMKVKAPMYYDDILGVEKELQTKSAGGELLGPLARTWANSQNYLNTTLLGSSRVALAQKFNVRQDLLRIANPFFELSFLGQKRVSAILKEGEEFQHLDANGVPTGEIGKTFSYNELKGRYTDKEIEGYYAARVLNDTIYQIKNTEVRERLVKDGFQGLSVELPGDRYFKNGAKLADNSEVLAGATRIFDPINNTTIRVTENKLDELSAEGLAVVKLLKQADTSKGKYSFAVVRKDDLHELPRQIYPYREGYNYRVNNDPYFIDRIEDTIVDGRREKHRSTIGVARNAEEANRFVKKAEEVNNFPTAPVRNVTFSSRWDRTLSSNDDALAADSDILDGSGMQYWFSERGDRLTRIDGSESSVEDPISAIHKMIGAVSNVSTHAKLLETGAIRHRKTFGHITDPNGRKLWNYDHVTQSWHFDKNLASSLKGEDAARALNEYIHLENIKYAPTWVDEKWKKLLEDIDTMFGRAPDKVSMASTKITSALAKTTPGRLARGAAFSLSIPLRPARHLLLQGSTGAHLFGIDPTAVAGSFKDATMMMFGLATYQNPKRWARTVKWAKALGYSEEEFTETFEAFRKSGVPFSVDSHVAVGEANFSWSRSIPESWTGWVGQKVAAGAMLPINLGKAIGFNTGELYNLAVTWSFAKRRYIKNNPGKPWNTQTAIDEITNKGRNFAIDMTRTAQFNYQKGAFSAMTQFLAINHKMLLNILGQDPEIGNIFKKGKRAGHARYLAGLFAIYGTAGFGLHEVYDQWIKSQDVEIDPVLDDILSGGFVQALFNTSLDLAFSDEIGTTRSAVGASIAPTSGAINFIPEFIESLIDGDMLEALSGPSGQTFKSIYNAANRVSEMWAIRDDLNTPQKILKSYQTALNEFGSFSDYYKYNLMMAYKQRMDKIYIVGKDGRPTVQANSMQEVWLKSVFGIQTRGEQEFYNEYLDLYRDLHSSGRKEQADYDKDAKHLAKYMYETYAKYGLSPEGTEKMKSIVFALHNSLDKRYGINVLQSARNQFKIDPRFDEFVSDLADTIGKGMFDADYNLQEMRNAVRNSDALAEESKQRLMDAVDQLDKSRESSRQLMNEYYDEN